MWKASISIVAAAFWLGAALKAAAVPGAPIPEVPSEALTADWWQWAMMQGHAGPVGDRTGALCGFGQRGDVWFLAGGFGSAKIHRSCEIPAGRKLFFPLVNMAYWQPQNRPRLSCETVRESAAVNNDTEIVLFAEIDGAPYDASKFQRIHTTHCFDLYERVPPEVGAYKAYPAASDGFWAMLRPLEPGRHVLKFGGRYNNKSSAYGRMVQDIEYELTVR